VKRVPSQFKQLFKDLAVLNKDKGSKTNRAFTVNVLFRFPKNPGLRGPTPSILWVIDSNDLAAVGAIMSKLVLPEGVTYEVMQSWPSLVTFEGFSRHVTNLAASQEKRQLRKSA